MVFPETMDPGEVMAIAMNIIVLSDPDGQDPDKTGRGQNIEADNLGLGGGVESSILILLIWRILQKKKW